MMVWFAVEKLWPMLAHQSRGGPRRQAMTLPGLTMMKASRKPR